MFLLVGAVLESANGFVVVEAVAPVALLKREVAPPDAPVAGGFVADGFVAPNKLVVPVAGAPNSPPPGAVPVVAPVVAAPVFPKMLLVGLLANRLAMRALNTQI